MGDPLRERQADRRPTYRKKHTGVYPWYGKGKKPGEYRLALGARDLAGNSTSTREFTVRLRYVQLFRKRFTPRAGRTLRVRVSADAKTVTWRLGRRRGTGKPPVLRISGAASLVATRSR